MNLWPRKRNRTRATAVAVAAGPVAEAERREHRVALVVDVGHVGAAGQALVERDRGRAARQAKLPALLDDRVGGEERGGLPVPAPVDGRGPAAYRPGLLRLARLGKHGDLRASLGRGRRSGCARPFRLVPATAAAAASATAASPAAQAAALIPAPRPRARRGRDPVPSEGRRTPPRTASRAGPARASCRRRSAGR